MAKDVLVTEVLSEQMITAGSKLVERLDVSNSEVKSAFWLFSPEERFWRLIVASPLVITEGPKNFYKRIVAVNQLATEKEWVISLNDIGVVGTDHQIVQLIRHAIGTGNGISGIRFSRNTINGYFIEDAFVFRSTI